MICFCRIDDRLIHGQVVTTWVNVKKIEQIIVVNDKVAGDKIQKNILNMEGRLRFYAMTLQCFLLAHYLTRLWVWNRLRFTVCFLLVIEKMVWYWMLL